MNGPLAGVRVLDLGIVGTGPKTALILSWLGADVIKVESPRFPDPFRFAAMFPAGKDGADEPWNLAVGANANNRHKRSVCLDYLRPEGRAALDRLIANSDVLLHNFRMSVADKAGLTSERVLGINPRMVLVALSSQGASGPRRDYGSYGATLEGLGGLAGLLGSAEHPLITSVNFPDQACPLLASGTIVASLVERDLTGCGAFIDFAQVEATALLSGDVVIAGQLKGDPDAFAAKAGCFKGVFRCAGDDEWIAVELRNSSDASALEDLLTTDGGPVNGNTDLETSLREWAVSRSPAEAESRLRSRGVPCARVLRGPEVLEHPALLARGHFEDIVSPRMGGVRRYNGNPLGTNLLPEAWHPRPAARMGADNREVLIELGFRHSEVDELESIGVLADRPQAGSDD